MRTSRKRTPPAASRRTLNNKAEFEDRALLEAAPIYDRIFERVINEIESRGDVELPDQVFDNLDIEFDSLADRLS